MFVVELYIVDSVDTPTAMHLMQELVKQTNVYLSAVPEPNAKLAGSIAEYLTFLFQVFGVIDKEKAIGFTSFEGPASSNQVMNYIYLFFAICN